VDGLLTVSIAPHCHREITDAYLRHLRNTNTSLKGKKPNGSFFIEKMILMEKSETRNTLTVF
jgi:hypothetical protein